MLSSKSKSVLDASVSKSTPSSPRASKLGRAGALKADSGTPSPIQASRLSVDRSPRSADHKPTERQSPRSADHKTTERQSPRTSTTPDKQPRATKRSEAQVQLAAAQEDLKNAKEQLATLEEEKSRLAEELKGAKKFANNANERLQEALSAQRKAEEASEIDKFSTDEMEQANIEATQNKEEEWKKELENVQNQHALDVVALLTTTEELHRVKHELSMITEAKNSALSHADDAMNIAEINAVKVERLNVEVIRLKTLFDSSEDNKAIESLELQKTEENLRAQLMALQEELNKANEKLFCIEVENNKLLEECKEAKRLSDEANEKLKEDLAIQSRAPETLVFEKHQTIELEEESIKVAQKREKDWIKQLECIQKQHSDDLAAFCSTKEELERLKHELAIFADEKIAALRQADDAMKIAEVNAEKVKLLSGENSELKAQLDLLQFDDDVSLLKIELEKANEAKEKLREMEGLIHNLRMECNSRLKAKLDSDQLSDEWKKKAELLEVNLLEANQSTKCYLESLASLMKQLEESNNLLEGKEREVCALKTKVHLLELELVSCKVSLDESSRKLNLMQQETFKMAKMIDSLKYDLQTAEETKNHVLNNENMAASKIKSLMEEKNKLISELEAARTDVEEIKGEMKSLNSELHKVSIEAREAQEKFLAKQAEVEDASAQIEDLKTSKEKARENYETALVKAKSEIARVQETCESFEREFKQSKSDWHSKEVEYTSSIMRSEREIAAMKTEIYKMAQSHKEAELQVQAAKEGEAQLINKLKQLEADAMTARKAAEAAKDESSRLKEMLLDKENELQSICQENDDLQVREHAATKKVEELSALLAEAKKKKPVEDNPYNSVLLLEPSNTVTNYESQKAPEANYSEEEADKSKAFESIGNIQDHISRWRLKYENNKEHVIEESLKLEGQVQENGMIDNDVSPDCCKPESLTSDFNTNIEINVNDLGSGLLLENAAIPPIKPQQQQKKKKTFMQRLGGLLKRKTNHP